MKRVLARTPRGRRSYTLIELLIVVALLGIAGALLVWQPGTELSIGALLIALACLAWGLDNGVTAQIDQLSPEHIVFLKGVVAGAANLLLGITVVTAGTGVAVADVLGALAIGALGYGASIVLWVKGARDLGAARGQIIFATAPFRVTRPERISRTTPARVALARRRRRASATRHRRQRRARSAARLPPLGARWPSQPARRAVPPTRRTGPLAARRARRRAAHRAWQQSRRADAGQRARRWPST